MTSIISKREAATTLTRNLDPRLARDLERLLFAEYDTEAIRILADAVPVLPDGFDLTDTEWRDAVLDSLDSTLANSEDGEDIDDVMTSMVPNYVSFARDLRDIDEK
mgnify:CR=1 FL=1